MQMSDLISIDVPVFFPADNNQTWDNIKETCSSINVVQNGQEQELTFFYQPSIAYDGFGYTRMEDRFPINMTMVNFSTRSRNPLVAPLVIRSLPWQSMRFDGDVKATFSPSESFNGQVRVLLSSNPQPLEAGNIQGLMAGTTQSHAFSCAQTSTKSFHVSLPRKEFQNALNGKVSPGTVTYGDIMPADMEKPVGQYNELCDMFSAHLLFDSVVPQAKDGILSVKPGTKIGILNFKFRVEFVGSRGNLYQAFIQDSLFKILNRYDLADQTIITRGGNGPTPIALSAQHPGQNAFAGQTVINALSLRDYKGSRRNVAQITGSVGVMSPFAKRILMQPHTETAKMLVKEYRRKFAGGRGDSDLAPITNYIGVNEIADASYSTGFYGCGKDLTYESTDDNQIQKFDFSVLSASPGKDLGRLPVWYSMYKGTGSIANVSEATDIATSYEAQYSYINSTVSKKKLGTAQSFIRGFGVTLNGDDSVVCSINHGKGTTIKGANGEGLAPALCVGSTFLIPAAWSPINKDGDSVEYSQMAITGLCGNIDMEMIAGGLDDFVVEYSGEPTAMFPGGDIKVSFDLPAKRVFFPSKIPVDEVGQGGNSVTSIFKAAAAGIQAALNTFGTNSAIPVGTVPFSTNLYMDGWQRSSVGEMEDVAVIYNGFYTGAQAFGNYYSIGQQVYDEKGRLFKCNLSSTVSGCTPVYVTVGVKKEDQAEDYMPIRADDSSWWTDPCGRALLYDSENILVDKDGQPCSFRNFFGDVTARVTITPLISRYTINDKHFSQCAVTAAPITDNVTYLDVIKLMVSNGNCATKAPRDGEWQWKMVDGGALNDCDVQVGATCFFNVMGSISTGVAFNIPEQLPVFNEVAGNVELANLLTDEPFHVYFQIGYQLFFDGYSETQLPEDVVVMAVIADGLTGEQRAPPYHEEHSIAFTSMDSILQPVCQKVDGKPVICLPMFNIKGVKTDVTVTSNVNSYAEARNPEGDDQEEE